MDVRGALTIIATDQPAHPGEGAQVVKDIRGVIGPCAVSPLSAIALRDAADRRSSRLACPCRRAALSHDAIVDICLHLLSTHADLAVRSPLCSCARARWRAAAVSVDG